MPWLPKGNQNMWFELMFEILQKVEERNGAIGKFASPILQSKGACRNSSYGILVLWKSYKIPSSKGTWNSSTMGFFFFFLQLTNKAYDYFLLLWSPYYRKHTSQNLKRCGFCKHFLSTFIRKILLNQPNIFLIFNTFISTIE